MSGERLYRLGPRERRGLVAGWRPGQVLSAAIGCALAGAVVTVSTSVVGIVVAVALVSAGIACATIPVRGRTIEEWVPVLAWFAAHRTERQVARIEVVAVSDEVGALRLDEHLVVVLELQARGITLLETDERTQLVEGLSSALAVLAREGSIVERVSWSAATELDDGARLARDLRLRGRGEVPGALESYRALLESVRGQVPHRSVHLALRARAGRGVGGTTFERLLAEAGQVTRALADAGHPAARLLSTAELGALVDERVAGEVELDGSLVTRATSTFTAASVGEDLVVAWWVAEWPRHEVTAELLSAALLGHEGRAMSVVFEPVATSVALRRAQVARTSGAADDEVRRRGGFLADRRREREASHLEHREAELVDGHASLRFAGYLSVRAPDGQRLEERIASTELAAAQSGLLLRRCQGDHVRGYLATQPLAVGLP